MAVKLDNRSTMTIDVIIFKAVALYLATPLFLLTLYIVVLAGNHKPGMLMSLAAFAALFSLSVKWCFDPADAAFNLIEICSDDSGLSITQRGQVERFEWGTITTLISSPYGGRVDGGQGTLYITGKHLGEESGFKISFSDGFRNDDLLADIMREQEEHLRARPHFGLRLPTSSSAV